MISLPSFRPITHDGYSNDTLSVGFQFAHHLTVLDIPQCDYFARPQKYRIDEIFMGQELKKIFALDTAMFALYMPFNGKNVFYVTSLVWILYIDFWAIKELNVKFLYNGWSIEPFEWCNFAEWYLNWFSASV